MSIEIVPVVPFEDGLAEGRQIGKAAVERRTRAALADKLMAGTLGAMSRESLTRYVMARLETPPDFVRFPELQDIHPERVDYLRGLAQGAECSLEQAAVLQYVEYRLGIDRWFHSLQAQRGPEHCSGIVLIGPDGVLGAHSVESTPPPMPKGFRHPRPKAYAGLKTVHEKVDRLVLRKPRTGYIEDWGVVNEKGVAFTCGTSCSTFLDDPIEDTWPVQGVPLLRFAATAAQAVELFQRYTLHNWGRGSSMVIDTSGDAAVIEKSFRRIGVRRREGASVLWCTEGHFESPGMHDFLRQRRLEYLRRMGMHLGSDDNQYFTDCQVRFAHIGELCHQPWGRGYEHMRRILTDHAPFPRAVCRHAGPDQDAYDRTITLDSVFRDVTHNRVIARSWVPWKKFSCQVPEQITQYPMPPG